MIRQVDMPLFKNVCAIGRGMFSYHQECTTDELVKMTWLRSVEWLHWPAFICQPLLPILYIYVYPPWVIAIVVVLNILWIPIRYHVPSLGIVTAGLYFVYLKWITIPVVAIYFVVHRAWLDVVAVIITPFIVWSLGAFTGGKVGIVQKKFLKQLGITEETAELRKSIDDFILKMSCR